MLASLTSSVSGKKLPCYFDPGSATNNIKLSGGTGQQKKGSYIFHATHLSVCLGKMHEYKHMINECRKILQNEELIKT